MESRIIRKINQQKEGLLKMNVKGPMEDESRKRTQYFDYLRVFAIFAIMVIHVSAQNWNCVSVKSFEWQIYNLYDSMVRFGVPIFLMISGSLFLNREIAIKKIYQKYILRVAIAFVFWSLLYAFFAGGGIRKHILNMINGHFHMWFLFIIIGMYMCIPIMKQIVQKKGILQYYFVLASIIAFLIPQLVLLVHDFGGKWSNQVVSAINNDISTMNLNLVLGFSFYFMLGYYLNQIELTKRKRILIYLCGMIGFLITVGLNAVVAIRTNTPCGTYYDAFTLNVFMESVAVFTFFQYHSFEGKKNYPLIVKLSKYSFGAYLVHVLILEQIKHYIGLNTQSFSAILSVPLLTVLIFLISFIISALLHHVPILNKYIV